MNISTTQSGETAVKTSQQVMAEMNEWLIDILSLGEMSEIDRQETLGRTYSLILHEALARVVEIMSEDEAKRLSQKLSEKPREDVLIDYLLSSVPNFDVIIEEVATEFLLDVLARMYPQGNNDPNEAASSQ